MPRQGEPDMHDPTDKELHTKEGVAPYPVPSKTKVAGQSERIAEDDETTSTPDNNFERAEKDEDGEHLDAADKMRKTLTEEGDKEAWKDGRTQGAPPRKH